MIASKSDKLLDSGNLIVLGVTSLLMLFPFYYIFVISFVTPKEYLQHQLVLFPQTWTLASYQYLLSTNAFIRSIGNTTFLATVGTVLSLLVTAALSYAISRRRLPGRKAMLLLILLTLLFQPGIIPPYLVVRQLGLINSLWSLIVPVLTSGWYVLLMKGFFDSIPVSLEESAKMDGCNDIGVWFRIILPLSLPAMAAFGLFYAVGYWNSFFTAVLYINDFDKWPLQLLLRNMLIDSSTAMGGDMFAEAKSAPPPETLKMAAVMIATVPILIVYPFLQKHFAKGVMLGSVKE